MKLCTTSLDQLQRLVSSMVSSQVLSNSMSFKGDTKNYRIWIKGIERHVTATGGNDDTKIAIAIQSSAGIVGEFLHQYSIDHPGANWQKIKNELVTRFSDVVDQAHAMSKLRHLKQAPNESVTLFAERLLDRAIDAFPEQGLEQPMIARQLVDICINGLKEAFIARKIMRDSPNTLAGAITIAVQEARLSKKFELRKRCFSSPCERLSQWTFIGAIQPGNFRTRVVCYNCDEAGHYAQDSLKPQTHCRKCYECGAAGHIARECFEPLSVSTGGRTPQGSK